MQSGSLDKAYAQYQAGNLSGAQREVYLILGEEPDDVAALGLLASIHIDQKNQPAALRVTQRILAIDPDLPMAWSQYGRVRIAQGNVLAAIDAFDRAVSLDPEDPLAHLCLAELRASLGQHKQALPLFEKALELEPEKVETLCAYAGWAQEVGKPYAQMVRRAAEISPDSRDVNLLLGTLALNNANRQEARDRALWLLQNNSEDEEALLLLAKAKAAGNPLLILWIWWDRFWRSMTVAAQIACMASLVFGFFIMRFLLSLSGQSWLVDGFTLMALLGAGVAACGRTIVEMMAEDERKSIHLRDDF